MTIERKGGMGGVPVSIGERLVNREGFMPLFREGMGLLEETADYLDGPGRDDSRALGRLASLAYATESMKLTTRLMQIASWLLLQRAINDGEISAEQGELEKRKIKLSSVTDESATTYHELPGRLRDLISHSHRIQDRVRHLDELTRGGGMSRMRRAPGNPVEEQISALRSALMEQR
ncbi:MAG: DUF1465 family protein [Flavobacteriaceae bacterium]